MHDEPGKMNETSEPSRPEPPPRISSRLQSLDALRGFDMFWIVGGLQIVQAMVMNKKLRAQRNTALTPKGGGPLTPRMSRQMRLIVTPMLCQSAKITYAQPAPCQRPTAMKQMKRWTYVLTRPLREPPRGT